jgi:hypothetical protein
MSCVYVKDGMDKLCCKRHLATIAICNLIELVTTMVRLLGGDILSFDDVGKRVARRLKLLDD